MAEAKPNGDDFISLKDIFRILIKRKKLLFVSFIILFALSGVYIFIQKPQHDFSRIITLPTFLNGANKTSVYSSSRLVDYINLVILPPLIDNNTELFNLVSVTSPKENPSLLQINASKLSTTLQQQAFNETAQKIYQATLVYEKPLVENFKKSLQQELILINQEIPALEKLRSDALNNINVNKENSQSTSDLKDIYIAKLSQNTNHSQLYSLRSTLANVKEHLSTLKPKSKISPLMNSHSKSPSKASMGLIAMLLSILISLFIVFIIDAIANVKRSLSEE